MTGLAVASNLALAVAITEGERPVLVIDTSARTRLADGPADRYRAVAVHVGRSLVYLANQDKQVKVMDLATRTIVATVELGFRVNAITIDEELDKAVLITDSGNKAHVLNLATNQLESDYTLPRHPGAISLNTDTHIAVIASRESDSLSLIDLTTNTLTAGFTLIDKAHAVAVSHRHNQAVVLSGVQNDLTFVQLPNPRPVLDSMTPVQAPVGAAALVLTLNGKGFFDGSKVFFGTDLLTTRLLGATRLEADVPASLLTTSRTVPVTVQNPSPSGGTSNALNFVVGGGPLLSAIFPGSAPADGQAKTLTLQGQNFASGATVLFGAAALAATVQSSTSLTVIVPAGPLTSSPGVVQVSVVNPGGQASNSLPFTFTPALVISGFTPASGPVGTAVTISGVGFNPVTSNNVVR
ncbi:MAG: IPT/TIG domain-containing protein, partial [Candidatus Rokuibacteriota bacterium]